MEGKVKINEIQEVHAGYSTGVFASQAKNILQDLRSDLITQGEVIISLVWVDDQKIQDLNKTYRGKDQPTDILSFSYLDDVDPTAEEKELGELVISNETLKRQAEEAGHADDQEALVLFTHGLLHILGYDHETKEDLAIMLDLEKKYLGDKAGLIARSRPE